MTSLSFAKATATGNDFIFMDAREPNFDQQLTMALGTTDRPQAVRRLCERHFGAGADGVVFLEPPSSTGVDVSWDFYNNDGSTAEMCGNAARCFALYAHSLKVTQNNLRFATLAGTISASVLADGLVEVTMTTPQLLHLQHTFASGHLGDLIDSGVPHIVLKVPVLKIDEAMRKQAQQLRFDAIAGVAGANVTFYQILEGQRIRSTTFERGVEDFTLSCGTGAVAAAVAFVQQLADRSTKMEWITVEVPGGMVEVGLDMTCTSARLRGPAQILFTGQIDQRWKV
jgi:diaminopimelate epimerase